MRRWALLLIPAIVALGFACSSKQPPILPDYDGGKPPPDPDAQPNGPCDPPVEGCPCAPIGDQLYCGLVYRHSGNRIDCSKGYRTCQEDGGWGACVGNAIYMGD